MKKFQMFSGIIIVLILIPLHILSESPIVQNWYYNTVLIENEWGKKGTGFLILRGKQPNQGKIFLCTNKHVLHENSKMRDSATKIKCYLNIKTNDNEIRPKSFVLGLVSSTGDRRWKEHPDTTVDVLVFIVTDLFITHPEIIKNFCTYDFIADSNIIEKENISVAEEILILGYPLGFKQGETNLPIVRQGIIATKIGQNYHENYIDNKGKKRTRILRGFLIDGGSIPGSSGSPVVLKPVMGRKVGKEWQMKTAKPYLLGILSETRFAPIKTKVGNLPGFAGLGFVFDAITIKEVIELFLN